MVTCSLIYLTSFVLSFDFLYYHLTASQLETSSSLVEMSMERMKGEFIYLRHQGTHVLLLQDHTPLPLLTLC